MLVFLLQQLQTVIHKNLINTNTNVPCMMKILIMFFTLTLKDEMEGEVGKG